MYFGTYIYKPIGNNKLSFSERKKLGSQCKLYVPNILEVGKITKEKLSKVLSLGDKVVFEEVLDGKLFSQIGLKSYIVGNIGKSMICIFDNHNLAFYFIGKCFLETGKKLDLIHIDQHSDLYEPYFYPTKLLNLQDIEKYTFEGINVGSWIKPLEKLGFIGSNVQLRTEYSVLNYKFGNIENSILDIDLDFWDENMTTSNKSLQRIKSFIGEAPLVLIATSPYFLNQKKAINLIYELLT